MIYRVAASVSDASSDQITLELVKLRLNEPRSLAADGSTVSA